MDKKGGLKMTGYKTCCCCGGSAGNYEQHYNRDDGYGICASCIAWLRNKGTSEEEILNLYGVEGINYKEAKA